MAWIWPWSRTGGEERARGDAPYSERKHLQPASLIALHGQGEARWTRRDYAGLAREGFIRNPIVHRAVKLIADAAASVPWLVYDGEAELSQHPLLSLLDRPNQRQAGGAFLEALYGHLLLSGNAYLELLDAGEGARELHLLRPDRVQVATDFSGWPVALEYRDPVARHRADRAADHASRRAEDARREELPRPAGQVRRNGHAGSPAFLSFLRVSHKAAERWRHDALLDAARRHCREKACVDMQPGDLLVFRWRADAPAKHAGILVAANRFIHAYQGHAVLVSALAPQWARRIAGVFEFPSSLTQGS